MKISKSSSRFIRTVKLPYLGISSEAFFRIAHRRIDKVSYFFYCADLEKIVLAKGKK